MKFISLDDATPRRVILAFANLASSLDRPQIVIWQDVLKDPKTVIAWKTIANCGYEWRYPMLLSSDIRYTWEDNFGNHSGEPLQAVPGTRYIHVRKGLCKLDSEVPSADSVAFHNALKRGSVNLNLWRKASLKGRPLLVSRRTLTAQQTVTFVPDLRFQAAIGSDAREGQPLIHGIETGAATEFDLSQSQTAYLLLLGGGRGSGLLPYSFRLTGAFQAHRNYRLPLLPAPR